MVLHPIAHTSLRIPASAFLFLLLSIIYIAVTPTARAAATFTPLGTFGGTDSQAFDVSADGSVVVGLLWNAPGIVPTGMFRWTAAGSMVIPGNFTYFTDVPLAVSGDGSTVVGQYDSPAGLQAFRWTVGGGIEVLGDFPGGNFNSGAFDVSYDGSVVVGFGSQPNPQGADAFRWTQSTGMVALAANTRIAGGVSADGSVVVGPSEDSSFRWTAESGAIDLSFAGSAQRISADGLVIVGTRFGLPPPSGSMRPQKEAFRWTESEGLIGLRSLSLPFRLESLAHNVSADGSVIVGSDGLGADIRDRKAFYWFNGIGDFRQMLLSFGVTNLDGWHLSDAYGVSADGLTVVGTGYYEGRAQAWVATIPYAVPEPSSVVIALIAAAAAFLAFHSYRRRSLCNSHRLYRPISFSANDL